MGHKSSLDYSPMLTSPLYFHVKSSSAVRVPIVASLNWKTKLRATMTKMETSVMIQPPPPPPLLLPKNGGRTEGGGLGKIIIVVVFKQL